MLYYFTRGREVVPALYEFSSKLEPSWGLGVSAISKSCYHSNTDIMHMEVRTGSSPKPARTCTWECAQVTAPKRVLHASAYHLAYTHVRLDLKTTI